MIKQLGTFLFAVGGVCALAASDFQPVVAAQVTIADSVRAEAPPSDDEMQIASLEEIFPSAESALAAAATAQAATRFEH